MQKEGNKGIRIKQLWSRIGQKLQYRYQRISFLAFMAFSLCLAVLGVANVAFINIQSDRTQKQLLTKSSTSALSLNYQVAVQTLNDIRLSDQAKAWATAETDGKERLEAVHLCNLVSKAVTDISELNYSIAMYKVNGVSPVFYKNGLAIDKDLFLKNQLGIADQQEWEQVVQSAREKGRYFIAAQGTVNEKSIVCVYSHKYWNEEVIYVLVVPCDKLQGLWTVMEGDRVLATNLYSRPDKLKWVGTQSAIASGMRYTEALFDGRLQCVIADDGNYLMLILKLLLAFLLLMAVGTVMMYHLSKLFYRPVDRLLRELDIAPEKEPDAPVKTIDEFALLRDNVFHLKLLNHKMQETLNENRAKSQEEYYLQMFSGNATEETHTAEVPQCAAVLRIEEQFDDDQIFLLKNDLRVFAQEREIVFVGVQPACWSLIFFDQDVEKVERIVRQALNQIFPESAIVAAISDVKQGKRAARRAYKQALHILEAYPYTPCGEILRADNVREAFAESFYYPVSVENELIHDVAEGNPAALELYDELVRENLVKRRMSMQQIENFIIALISTANRIGSKLSAAQQKGNVQISTSAELLSVYESHGEHAVTEMIRKQIAQVVEDINQNRSTDNNIQMRKMLDYIHENYMRDIGLTDIAEEIGITPQHCSIAFKQLTNDNFKNYLNSYRIKKAQELQQSNPGISTAQLAQSVGFNSSNSFIRAYKKYTGISPQSYQAANQK